MKLELIYLQNRQYFSGTAVGCQRHQVVDSFHAILVFLMQKYKNNPLSKHSLSIFLLPLQSNLLINNKIMNMEYDTDFDESTYTYQHPDYPKTLEMENPWVGEELCKPENALGLKPQLVKRILALPADSLRLDLERLIMYHVGLTCDDISDDYDPGDRFNGVIGSSLILLADVGNGESSLDVVLEVMRQSPDFSEYHIYDAGEELLIPTICKLGQEHLGKLLAYAKESGLYAYLQCQAFAAMRVMAFYNPDLRQPVIEAFRDLLRYYADYSQSHDVDRELMGLLVCEVTDLHAPELLPEVKALYDIGAVHEGTSGDYKSVARDIKKRDFENPVNRYCFTAEARFKKCASFTKDDCCSAA